MKNWKIYAVISLLLFAVAAAGTALYFKHQFDNKELLNSGVKKDIQTEASIIAREVDKNGLQHVTIEAAKNIVSVGDIDKVAISKGIMDTTALALGIQKRQIESLLSINATLKAENLKAKQIILTNGQVAFQYQDKFIKNLRYTPPAGIDTMDHGNFDFAYNADLNIVQYWKRKWFLGAKKSYIDIYSNDKRTTVNGAQQLTVQQDQPDFGLRIQAAANYNPQTGAMGFGPAARIDLGRFSIQGNYTWYPQSDRWRPSVNANFDLIRF
ncbi:hypothetical protein ACJVDH_00465 [Pedobacter sp. AW1-32]|uniref:hypothetical protein n=1 Tax=Pedobacter sp. AW1-32 TaxID=3383026 RepID=UPI003FF0B679